MVISFSHDSVFQFLDDHGYVVTFRKKRRSNLFGETWVNRGRGMSKEFNCFITEIGKVIDPGQSKNSMKNPELNEWVEVNGLPTDFVSDWVDVIRSLNDEVPEEGYLYFVRKKETNGEQSELDLSKEL